ncbi:MAG: putative metal-binding motif-containing protein, partial [Flavobacteriales bacterium]
TWIDQNLGDYLNQVFLIWANCFGSDPNCVEQQLIELEQTGEVPLSLACHSCAITYVQCIQSTCLTACIGNPLGAGCQQCIATSCRPAFLNCAGLIDEDGDGWSTGSDCNDSDPNIYPGAPEPCDGNDNDCDGEVDEGAIVTWYLDQDGDGYGAGTGTADCAAPGPNYTDNDFDCDDNDPAVFPGQGCAGFDCGFYYGTDQGTCGQGTFCDNGVCVPCQDLDGDGFFECDGDCDDNNPDVYPGSPELCDGLDNDCNGAVDEFFTWYEDSDGDGFGNTVTATFNCEQPVGFVSVSGDCNDEDPAIYPLAGPGLGCVSCSVDDRNWIQDNYLNLWNTTGQVVQDCEGLSGQDLWNCLAAQLTSLTPIATSCLQCVVERAYCAATTCGSACIPFLLGSNEVVGGSPECVQCMVANGCHSTFAACVGLVDMDGDGAQASQDCNDNNAAIYPGAPEPCNGVDHDCDGQVAPQCQCAVGQVEVCGSSIGQCQPGTRTCLEGGIWSSCVGEVPPAPEICNGIDDDCDGATDEDPVSGPIWYRDADLDGFGTPSNTVIACSPPFGYVSNSLDCDDTNAAINPAAPEACNGIDDNCNGMSDEGFNTQDDSQNCGACGIVCPPGATCVNGQCVE